MTQEEFEEFVYEIIPQQLFHVDTTDLNEEGIRLDELILLDALHRNPEALKFKRLDWFVEYFIGSYDKNNFNIKK